MFPLIGGKNGKEHSPFAGIKQFDNRQVGSSSKEQRNPEELIDFTVLAERLFLD